MDVIEIDRYHVRPDLVREVAAALLDGQLVAIPTDAAMSVLVQIGHRRGIERLVRLRLDMAGSDEARVRAREKPPAIVFADLEMLSPFVTLSQTAYQVVKRLFPGAYTIILPATRDVPRKLQDKRRFVGARIPDDELVRAVVRAVGTPLLSVTAKSPEGELIEDALELSNHWTHQIDLAVDGGWFVPESSTVLEVTGDEVVVIREGKGSLNDL